MAEKVISSTQAFLPIAEIKEGTVVMRDGSLRGVILVSSLNFALKSDEEKDAIVMSFQNFINSLDFPIQIVANSRKLDLSAYLASVQAEAAKLQSSLIKLQAEEYISFVNGLLETANIMEKRFFVVVPYYPTPGMEDVPGIKSLAKKKQETPQGNFDINKKALLSRIEEIIQGLMGVGLRCAALGTEDLLELYYSMYNPDTARNQKISGIEEANVSVISGGENEIIQ